MEGTIINFRRGRTTMRGNQMIVEVKDYDTKAKAAQLIGKKVLWTTPAKKEIHGKIVAVHGNKGAIRARFRRGMPGQAIGSKIAILDKPVQKKAPGKSQKIAGVAPKKTEKPKAEKK